jgi:hypothetical protein
MTKVNEQLSFGIMCESNYLAEWQARCVRNLMQEPNIKLKLIIQSSESKTSPRSRFRKIKLKRILYLLYNKYFFRPSCNEPADMSEWYKDALVVKCEVTLKGKFSQYFKQEDVDLIKSHHLDFILRFGFNIIRGEILKAAKHGVWSFHHDDPAKYRGGPPGFWEIAKNDFVTGSVLQKLTDELDNGISLRKGYFKTCLYSYQKNVNAIYFASSEWPLLVCKEIILNGGCIVTHEPIGSEASIYYPPTNFQFLSFIIRIIFNSTKTLCRHLFFREVWNVGWIEESVQHCMEKDFDPPINFIGKLPTDEFYADPFGFIRNGDQYILLEKFNFGNAIGKIETWQQFGNKDFQKTELTFQNVDGHQSYPYVFADKEELYCLPETSQIGKLVLHRLTKMGWKEECIIMKNVPCVDPTLLRHDNMYWLFYTRADKNADLNLYINYAESLHGPWEEHPRNPVKTDIRSSRPAGSIFKYRNELYRPSQNSSKTYGGSIVINKIKILDQKEYKEEATKELLPWDKYFRDGIHTLSVFGDKTLVDGKKIQFKIGRRNR